MPPGLSGRSIEVRSISEPGPAPTTGSCGRGRPSREAAPVRHANLLSAAIRHFLEHGVELASMDAIAREAGVSKATVYRHYTDKLHLFAVACDAFERKFMVDLHDLDVTMATPEEMLPDVAERLLCSMLVDIDGLGRGLDLTRINWAIGYERHAFVRAGLDIFRKQAIAPLTRYLERNIRQGRLCLADAEDAAWRFIDMTFFYSHTMCRVDPVQSDARRTLARRAADLFLYGALSRTPAAIGRALEDGATG